MKTPLFGESLDFSTILKTLDSECKNCSPVNPLKCVTRCKFWKIKNEFRQLREKIDRNPNFTKKLFNALKNETRLHILHEIAVGRHSIVQIQQELKKTDYAHSQETIYQEYLIPLIDVGLATKTREEFCATNLGKRITELLHTSLEFFAILPAHSKCYEETLLSTLLTGPKTYKEMEALFSPKTVSRILKRLKSANLIRTPKEKEYVFFFRSRRDPRKENFSLTEKRVYSSIPDEGISAKSLAKKTSLSVRRIYKYLRGLKGKKLVFSRKTPKVYSLTDKGEKLGSLLREIQDIVDETWACSEQVLNGSEKN